MPPTIHLQIITFNKRVVEALCEEVRIPGVAGEFQVLVDHAPLIAELTAGVVSYTEGGQEKRLPIASGYAHVLDNAVVLLVDENAVSQWRC